MGEAPLSLVGPGLTTAGVGVIPPPFVGGVLVSTGVKPEEIELPPPPPPPQPTKSSEEANIVIPILFISISVIHSRFRYALR